MLKMFVWALIFSTPEISFSSDHPQPLIAAQRVRAALRDLRAEISAMDVRIGVATATVWDHQMRAQRQPEVKK